MYVTPKGCEMHHVCRQTACSNFFASSLLALFFGDVPGMFNCRTCRSYTRCMATSMSQSMNQLSSNRAASSPHGASSAVQKIYLIPQDLM